MTPNKYHPEGGEYTAQELRERKLDTQANYVFGRGHSFHEIGKTLAEGRNAMKRAKRAQAKAWRKALC